MKAAFFRQSVLICFINKHIIARSKGKSTKRDFYEGRNDKRFLLKFISSGSFIFCVCASGRTRPLDFANALISDVFSTCNGGEWLCKKKACPGQ